MAACPDLRAQNRKRQYAGADLSQENLFARPSKKSKRKNHHSASRFPPPSPSTSKTSNTSGRRSSAYEADVEQHLVDRGIYPDGYNYHDREKPEPDNFEEIHQRLAQLRQSLSPSVFSISAFRDSKRANVRVIDKSEVMRDALPTVYGNANIPHKENLLFTRLESITDKATVDAKPDFYDGAPADSLEAQVRADPIAPNLFLEAKGPKGWADVAKRQTTHDLALGARGMHQLQSYAAGKPLYDNHAYTLGATYHAGTGTLQMYTSHVTPGGSSEYHTTQIGNPDTYRRGATALRNGRDMMKEYRDQFISTANERARSTLDLSTNSGLSCTTEIYLCEASQTSPDEPGATSFYINEHPELSEDELAGKSSRRVASVYPTTSFPDPATASPSCRLSSLQTIS